MRTISLIVGQAAASLGTTWGVGSESEERESKLEGLQIERETKRVSMLIISLPPTIRWLITFRPLNKVTTCSVSAGTPADCASRTDFVGFQIENWSENREFDSKAPLTNRVSTTQHPINGNLWAWSDCWPDSVWILDRFSWSIKLPKTDYRILWTACWALRFVSPFVWFIAACRLC